MSNLETKAASMGTEEKLKEMGIVLHDPKPVDTDAWNLVLCRQVGNLVYVSGEGPEFPDGTWTSGRLGEDITIEEDVYKRQTFLTIRCVRKSRFFLPITNGFTARPMLALELSLLFFSKGRRRSAGDMDN